MFPLCSRQQHCYRAVILASNRWQSKLNPLTTPDRALGTNPCLSGLRDATTIFLPITPHGATISRCSLPEHKRIFKGGSARLPSAILLKICARTAPGIFDNFGGFGNLARRGAMHLSVHFNIFKGKVRAQPPACLKFVLLSNSCSYAEKGCFKQLWLQVSVGKSLHNLQQP